MLLASLIWLMIFANIEQQNEYFSQFFKIKSNFNFFYSCFHLYGYCLIHIPTLFSPFFPSLSFIPFLPETPPPSPPAFWERGHNYYLVCFIAFARGHREIAENQPPIYSLWKITFHSEFCCAGGYSSKYWFSVKLLDSGDRLAPDTYYTPNTVGLENLN